MKERDRPFCQIVDGHRLPGSFSEEVYRSGLLYKPEEGDLIVAAFPKCGTHWVTEMLKASYEVCKGVTPGITFLEMFGLDGILKANKPKIVFTHLPFDRAPPFSSTNKYIVLARNPKDCCVSFYNHTKNLPPYGFTDGTFDEYFEIFLDGRTDFGNYYETLRSWYAVRDRPNVLLVTYESLHADLVGSILKIVGFVDQDMAKQLAADTVKMQAVLEKITLDNMKKQFAISFVRKGIVGDWKNYFSEEQSRRLEDRFFKEMEGTSVPDLWSNVDWLVNEKKNTS